MGGFYFTGVVVSPKELREVIDQPLVSAPRRGHGVIPVEPNREWRRRQDGCWEEWLREDYDG